MEIQKTLRWLDPYESWGNHEDSYYKSNFLDKNIVPDTGLCNRLLHWETAYHIINQPKHKDYKILLQKKIWPELDLISLPHTYLVNYNESYYQWQSYYKYDELHFKTVLDVTKNDVRLASPINETLFRKVVTGSEDLSNDSHWYSNFKFIPLSDFSGIKKRYLNHIRLKHTEINDFIKSKYKDYVGIHIRRGNGVCYTEEDIQSLPEPLREKYRKFRKEHGSVEDNNYNFVQDDFYYNVIKELRKKNPSQKFYISHDMDDEYINHYYEDFGHHVIESKYNNRYFFETYYSNAGVDVTHLKNYSNAIDNVVDLFTLASCGMVVGFSHSTWSEFSRDYSPKLYNDSGDSVADIVKTHEKLNLSIKSAI